MIITYVNRLCQKHSRAMFLVILAIIVVPFIFIWGSPQDFLSASRWRGGKIGDMFGRRITKEAFLAQLTAVEISHYFRSGQMLSEDAEARGYWYAEALRRMRALHEARRRGLGQVGDAEVAQAIRGVWLFQKDGAFDQAQFAQFRDRFLRPRGVEPQQFDAMIRDNLVIERLEAQVGEGAFVAPEEVRQTCVMLQEKTGLGLRRFPAAAHREQAAAAVTPEAVPAWYQAHVEPFRKDVTAGLTPQTLLQKRMQEIGRLPGKSEEQKAALFSEYQEQVRTYLMPYFVPEQKRVRVAVFPLATFREQARVSEEAVAAHYAENRAEYEREEVQARHILLRLAGDATPETKEAKRKLLAGLRQQIAGGADFAALARQHSEDTGSKGAGGDLGWFAKGQMVEAFETAAFALKKGELSEIVETPFGLHLLQVQDRRPGRTLGDVRAEITEKLTADAASLLAMKAAQAFGDSVFEQLENAAAGQKPVAVLAEAAAKAKVEAVDSDWFSGAVIPPFGAEAELARQAGKLTAQRPLSETIKGKDAYYVACWVATRPASLPELAGNAELEARVRSQIVEERAVQLAREKARAELAALQAQHAAGTDLVAAKDGWEDLPEFTRMQPPKLPEARALLDAVAGVPVGQVAGPVETADGAMLALVKARVPPTDEERLKLAPDVEQGLKRQKQMLALRRFYERLEAESNTVMADGWGAEE